MAFDPMNVVEGFDFFGDDKVHAEIWDDGAVVFTKDFSEEDMKIDLARLEKFVTGARAWINAREEMKNRGTQP